MPYTGDYQAFLQLSAAEVQALVDELAQRPLNADSMDGWLRDWSDMGVLFQESLARMDIAVSVNTADTEAVQRVNDFRQTIWPIGHKMYADLMERLYAHEALIPPVLSPTLASLKRQAALNQTEEAVALVNQEYELMNAYSALLGAHTIEWQGQTLADRQIRVFLNDSDPAVRKEVWHLLMARRAQDRATIHDIWQKLLVLRQKIAQANGFESYLAYRWHEMDRIDYTPQDSDALHQAIQAAWSPLYARLVQQRQQALSLDRLAPWDTDVLTTDKPLKPFATGDELVAKTSRLFHRLDAEFGAMFDRLVAMGFVDIAVRKNTAAVGGFARGVGKAGVFVMLNLEGQRTDVENLVHEMGHAFAMMESTKLPYHVQWGFSPDFTETPSSVMEMLSMPYWDEFYQGPDLIQAKHDYFEEMIYHNLKEVVIEAFQLWAYRHPDEAQDMARCDAKWFELHQQYLPGIDYGAEQDYVAMGWQRSVLLVYAPFMAMEYVYGRLAGLSLLRGTEPAANLTRYKHAIRLGSSVTTVESFAALGLQFFPTADEIATVTRQLESYLFG